jgi:hypothetical protein
MAGLGTLLFPSSGLHASPKPLRFILNGHALTTFTTNSTSTAFFAGKRPFVVVSKKWPVAIPPSWNAVPTRIFTSYREFHWAVTNGKIQPEIRAVIYDNEAWSLTPRYEQNDLARFAQRFAQLAHQHGYFVIVTPAVDLATAAQSPGEKRFSAFLRLQIPANAAKYADAIDIQAQGSEVPAWVFADYVRSAAAQARAANPSVLVLAGISTNPSGRHVTAAQVAGAIQATRAIVDGYWFNVPQEGPSCPRCNDFRPDIAIDVLRQIAQ